MMGGYVVRVSGSALACPDWPTCFGSFGLPEPLQAQTQVVHRGLALAATLMTLAASVWAQARYRSHRLMAASLHFASFLMLVQIAFGAGIIFLHPAAWLTPVHMALAMLALGGLVTASVVVLTQPPAVRQPRRLVFRSPFARLAVASAAAVLVLMASGALVTAAGAGEACPGWPLCNGGLPTASAGWLALGHRLVTLIVAVLLTALFTLAWRSQRSQPVTLTAATAAFVLFVGEALIGGLKVSRGFPLDLIGLHAAGAAGMWAALLVTVAAAGLAGRTAAEERAEALQPVSPLPARLKDFFYLSKPLIVALLLVTTYAGMVVGGRSIPSLSLTFWTILGGALAAGGSSALNQYIDRRIDGSMQRTARRPLPAGRITPAEAVAFGVAACLAAFFVLAGFVNLLAALLSLAGMVYYVLVYSIWLKHATVQNIVIGGGAGAIPPLVGWAAATGSLNVPSLFLFGLIFLWTPPHFWALALVRRNDYARAGVPMLPVVRGERATRLQIFIYTLELVGLTLLMPLFKIAGSLFLVSAVVLGLWLVAAAYRVLRRPGNKVAWQMYRYSSMYLAFIMLALVLDVLI